MTTETVSWREVAIREGLSMADMEFSRRGAGPGHDGKVHLRKEELATLLAAAWELGNDAARKAKS